MVIVIFRRFRCLGIGFLFGFGFVLLLCLCKVWLLSVLVIC